MNEKNINACGVKVDSKLSLNCGKCDKTFARKFRLKNTLKQFMRKQDIKSALYETIVLDIVQT